MEVVEKRAEQGSGLGNVLGRDEAVGLGPIQALGLGLDEAKNKAPIEAVVQAADKAPAKARFKVLSPPLKRPAEKCLSKPLSKRPGGRRRGEAKASKSEGETTK
jgi:hypothetical protein